MCVLWENWILMKSTLFVLHCYTMIRVTLLYSTTWSMNINMSDKTICLVSIRISYWHSATIKPEICKVFKTRFWPVHMKDHTRKSPFGPKIIIPPTQFVGNNRCWSFGLKNFAAHFLVTWVDQSHHVIYQNDRIDICYQRLEPDF